MESEEHQRILEKNLIMGEIVNRVKVDTIGAVAMDNSDKAVRWET